MEAALHGLWALSVCRSGGFLGLDWLQLAMTSMDVSASSWSADGDEVFMLDSDNEAGTNQRV